MVVLIWAFLAKIPHMWFPPWLWARLRSRACLYACLCLGLFCAWPNSTVSEASAAVAAWSSACVCEWAHARMCHRACTRWSPSPIASLLKLTESTLSSFKDREMRFFPVWIILEKWASGMNCPNKLACFSILFYCLFWLNLLFFIFLPRKLQVLWQAKPFWKSAMAFKWIREIFAEKGWWLPV